MKAIKEVRKSILTIALLVFCSINCTPQTKPNEQKTQQPPFEVPEAKLVRKDLGTITEELQGQLQLAIGNNDIEEIEALVRKGVNINKLPGNTDMTPIMLAETKEIAQVLLKNGADPLVMDATGKNLLHYAVSKEDAGDLIVLYASLGVEINAREQEDYTPISLALTYFDEANAFDSQQVFVGSANNRSNNKDFKPDPYKTLKTLVESGADLNAFDQYGYTLLMNYVTSGNPKLISILLELGADKTVQNKYGQTAKEIAYNEGKRAIYQMLE